MRAGAVAEAAAISFAGLSDATAHATVIDPDPLDLSNDNRYALATLEDDENPKAPFMANFLARRGFTQYPYVGTWQDYVIPGAGVRQIAPILMLLRRVFGINSYYRAWTTTAHGTPSNSYGRN